MSSFERFHCKCQNALNCPQVPLEVCLCYVVVHTCTGILCSMYDLTLCTIMYYLHVYYIFTILYVRNVTATAFDLFDIAMATNQQFRLHSPIVNATLLYPKQISYPLGALRDSFYFPTPDTNNILIWKGNLGLWCGASEQLLLCQKLSLR